MRVPEGHTEASVMAAVDRALDKLLAAKKVKPFGYFTRDDLCQQAWVIVLEILDREKWNPAKQSLPAFFYVHLRNRLKNFKRDTYCRNDPPCKGCAANRWCAAGATGPCPKQAAWTARNVRRMALVSPMDIDKVADEKENAMRASDMVAEEAHLSDLTKRIDALMPAKLRPHYLRIRDGAPVDPALREQVLAIVREAAGLLPPGPAGGSEERSDELSEGEERAGPSGQKSRRAAR